MRSQYKQNARLRKINSHTVIRKPRHGALALPPLGVKYIITFPLFLKNAGVGVYASRMHPRDTQFFPFWLLSKAGGRERMRISAITSALEAS